MRVYVESILPCSPEAAWAEVLKSDILLEVSWPIVDLMPVGALLLPEIWQAQQTLQVKTFLFGLVSLGTRTLQFQQINHENRKIQTTESDPLVRRWDHLISIEDAGEGRSRYSDTVEIDAGPWTWIVWLFAQCFYRHRQRRWRRIAQRLSFCGKSVADS